MDDVEVLWNALRDGGIIAEALCRAATKASVDQRVSELRFIGLCSDLSIEQTRARWCESEEDAEDAPNLLGQLRDLAQNAPMDDKNEATRDEWRTSEDTWVLRREPCGRLETVIIDCYGLYVPSLVYWIEGLATHGRIPVEMQSCLDALRADPGLDGPAVLLCPELIRKLYPLASMVSSEIRSTSLASNPDLMFLKLTLLHELGHHLYPVPRSRILREAFANWFVYNAIPPMERRALHAKTLTQAFEYQMYQGLVALQPPAILYMPMAMSLPWNLLMGNGFVQPFERAAFNRQPLGAISLGALSADLENWVMSYAHIAVSVLQTGPLPEVWRKGKHGTGLHPAAAKALMLLCYAMPRDGQVIAESMMRLYTSRPMPPSYQRLWWEQMWNLPHWID